MNLPGTSKRLKLAKRLLDPVLNVVHLKIQLKDKYRKAFCPMQVLHKKPGFSQEGVSLRLIDPKSLPVSLSVRFCTKLSTKDHRKASVSHASLCKS